MRVVASGADVGGQPLADGFSRRPIGERARLLRGKGECGECVVQEGLRTLRDNQALERARNKLEAPCMACRQKGPFKKSDPSCLRALRGAKMPFPPAAGTA